MATDTVFTMHATTEATKTKRLALVIEDTREACQELKLHDWDCRRITHAEVLSLSADEILREIIQGHYSLLWVSIPHDWYVRPAYKRTTTLWTRICAWATRMHAQGHWIAVAGPPSSHWKQQTLTTLCTQLQLQKHRLRLCAIGQKWDSTSTKPSGSYVQIVTNMPVKHTWHCKCKIPMEQHTLDWYGKTEQHAHWRRQMRMLAFQHMLTSMKGMPLRRSTHKPENKVTNITDVDSTPPSLLACEATCVTAMCVDDGQTEIEDGQTEIQKHKKPPHSPPKHDCDRRRN